MAEWINMGPGSGRHGARWHPKGAPDTCLLIEKRGNRFVVRRKPIDVGEVLATLPTLEAAKVAYLFLTATHG